MLLLLLLFFVGVCELFSLDGIAGQEKWKKNARFLPCISDERSEERQDGCRGGGGGGEGGGGEDGSQDEGMQESDICDSINTADIHEIVVTRVNETLTAYKNAQGQFDTLSSSSLCRRWRQLLQ